VDHVPGVRSHYLPASYLGGFSLQSQGKLRERPVCVLRRNDGGPFVTKAEGIGWKRGLDIEPDDPTRDGFKSFEEVWGSYESLLPEAICELVGSAGSMAAELWLLALVPFVGGLFARGPDFERRRATATSSFSRGWHTVGRRTHIPLAVIRASSHASTSNGLSLASSPHLRATSTCY